MTLFDAASELRLLSDLSLWDISSPAVHHTGAGGASIPADQLALLKSRALNISRVHICVIGADLRAGLSVSEHPRTVKNKQRKTGQEERALKWIRA